MDARNAHPSHHVRDQPRLRAAATAALPSCSGDALNAARAPPRALAVCILLSNASNSSFRVSSLACVVRESARYSSIESKTALGVSCFVMRTTPSRTTQSSSSPNLFLASLALILTASSPRRLRMAIAVFRFKRLLGIGNVTLLSSRVPQLGCSACIRHFSYFS